jgi:hypothetical protein
LGVERLQQARVETLRNLAQQLQLRREIPNARGMLSGEQIIQALTG